MSKIITCEQVSNGHPDKICDQIADAIVTDCLQHDKKLVWECPNCGNRDEKRMNVCRRVCGYLGTNYFNQGRTQEIAERVLHL